MATREEIIRFAYQITGDEEFAQAAGKMAQLGDVSEQTADHIRDLARQFADASNASKAAEQYEAVAKAQRQLAAQTEKAGLALKLADGQHTKNVEALSEAERALTRARNAQLEYGRQTDKTAAQQNELRDAVRAAHSYRKQANDAWKESARVLRGAEKGYRAAAAAQGKLDRELGELDSALSKAGVSSQNLGEAQVVLGRRTKGAAEQLQRLRESALEAQRVSKAHELLNTRPFDEIAADIRKVRAAYKQLERSGQLTGRALAQAHARMVENIQELEGQTNGWAQSLDKVKVEAGLAIAASAGFVRVLAGMTRSAMAFEEAMASIETLTGDGAGIAKLSAQVRELSAQFGGDATANAKSLYEILSAGVDDSAKAMGILTIANKLAVGGLTDVNNAAKGVVATLNAFGMGVEHAGDVADGFFVAAKAGATSVDELANSVGRIAPIAASAGLSFDKMLAAIATLTNTGLSTDEAVTQLRSALANIVAPSQQAKKAAAQLGIEFGTAAVRSRGLAGFLAYVSDAAQGNTEVLSQLFGNVNALQGVMALGGSQAGAFADALDQMSNRAGAANEAVSIMGETGANKIKRFRESIQNLSDSFGSLIAELAPMTEGLAKFANMFAKMPVWVRGAVAAFAANLAILGPMTIALKRLSPALGLMKADFIAAASGASAWAESVDGTTKRLGRLRNGVVKLREGLRSLPRSIKMVFAAEGLAFTYQQLSRLNEVIGDYIDASRKWNAIEADRAQTQSALLKKASQLRGELSKYADTQILATDAVQKLGLAEAERYQKSLRDAKRYYIALRVGAEHAGDAAQKAFAAEKVAEYGKAMARVAPVIQTMGEEVGRAAQAAKDADSALGLIGSRLDHVAESASIAESGITGLFDELGVATAPLDDLGQVALALDFISRRGDKAAQSIREGLGASLRKLSVDEFNRFGRAAREAFAEISGGAQKASTVMEAYVAGAMDRLGAHVEMSGREAVSVFRSLVQSGGASARELSASFEATLSKIGDASEIKELRSVLGTLYDRGIISAKQYQAELDKLQQKLDSLDGGGDKNLGDSFRGATDAAKEFGQVAQKTNAQLAAEARAAGKEVAKIGGQFVEVSHDAGGAANAIANFLGGWHAEFAKTSSAAAEAFDRMAKGVFHYGMTMSQYFDNVSAGIKGLQQDTAAQKEGLAEMLDVVGRVGTESAAAMSQFTGSTGESIAEMDRLIERAKEGKTKFDLLGKSDMSQLISALEAAKQRVQALEQQSIQARQQLEGIGSSLQDQIDRMQGDEAAIEKRRYQQQLERLREIAEKTDNLNSSEYREAVRKAKRLHALKMKQVREQQEAQDKADKDADDDTTPPDSSQPSGGGGASSGGNGTGGVTINLHSAVTDPRTLDTFARKIKNHMDDIARRSR